jgi:hypothetical protein
MTKFASIAVLLCVTAFTLAACKPAESTTTTESKTESAAAVPSVPVTTEAPKS